jgi:hypothetical protein
MLYYGNLELNTKFNIQHAMLTVFLVAGGILLAKQIIGKKKHEKHK